MLNISLGLAEALLIQSKWSQDKASIEYLDNEIYKSLTPDTSPKDKLSRSKKVECTICYYRKPLKDFVFLECNNCVCKKCFGDYITTKLSESLPPIRCPFCKDHCIGRDLIKEHCSRELYEKYVTQVIITHIKEVPGLRMCSECGLIAQLTSAEVPDYVNCDCKYSYCWKCGDRNHFPLQCSLIQKWKESCNDKDGKLAEQWIIANTKKCPSCHTPIQKSTGCNHMTCRKCGHEFCWVCLADWKEHGYDGLTGGIYSGSCVNYEKSKQKKIDEEAGNEREKIRRYEFYYERFKNSEKDLEVLSKKLETAEKKITSFEKSRADQDSFGVNTDFIREGVIVEQECRRLIMYSFIVSYFMPLALKTKEEQNAKDLFDKNQESLNLIMGKLEDLNAKPVAEIDIQEFKTAIKNGEKFLENMNNSFKEISPDSWEQEQKTSVSAPELDPPSAPKMLAAGQSHEVTFKWWSSYGN